VSTVIAVWLCWTGGLVQGAFGVRCVPVGGSGLVRTLETGCVVSVLCGFDSGVW